MRILSIACIVFSSIMCAVADENIYGNTAVMAGPAQPSGMRGTASDLPDISVVGDIVGKLSNVGNDADRDKLQLRSVEFAYQGYVYPEMKANVILAFHKHEGAIESEIEEANVLFTNLYRGVSLKAGKMLGSFGIVNGYHPHHLPYVDQPNAHTNFLGGHGLMLEGAVMSYLLPLPFYAQIDAGWGHAPAGHHHAASDAATTTIVDANGDTVTVDLHEEHVHTFFSLADQVSTGRLKMSFPLGRDAELTTGASIAAGKGAHYEEHSDETRVTGADVTFKSFPGAFSRMVWQSEYFNLHREVPIGTITRDGFYSYLGYRANQYWTFGTRYDYAQDAFPHADATGADSVNVSQDTRAQSLIVTRNLTETTYLRGQYKYYMEPEGRFEAYLQLSFGIGPHSHPLE